MDMRLSAVKGQAQFRQLRAALLADQTLLHREMRELVTASRLDRCPLYLQLHVSRPADTSSASDGLWRLRWRMAVEGGFRHVLWQDIQGVLGGLPVAMAQHLGRVHRRAAEVNVLDGLLQVQVSRIERFLGIRAEVKKAGMQYALELT